LLNASLTLNPNDRFSLFHAGAVVSKARAIEDALNTEASRSCLFSTENGIWAER